MTRIDPNEGYWFYDQTFFRCLINSDSNYQNDNYIRALANSLYVLSKFHSK